MIYLSTDNRGNSHVLRKILFNHAMEFGICPLVDEDHQFRYSLFQSNV